MIVSPKHFSDELGKFKKKTIFDGINSIENLRVAKNIGARYYSGTLLQEENSLKDFDILTKQSKIYLKELIDNTLEGGRHE